MRILRKSLLLIVLVSSFALPRSSFGSVPERINYQGRLVDGTNLVNDTVEIVFSIYDQQTGGNLHYIETQTVVVADGLFAAHIGASNTPPWDLTEALTNNQVYLSVSVDGIEMTPRERMASVPYALRAHGVRAAGVTTDMLAGNAVTSAKIADGTISNADIDASASIAGSKIADVLLLDGSRTMTGDLDIGDHVITNLESLQGSGGYLKHIDSHDPDDYAAGVWGDGDFVYLANGEGGLHTYAVDGDGILTHIHSDGPGFLTAYKGVWGDGTFVYVANFYGDLFTYSVDVAGTLTQIHGQFPGGTPNGVWGDGSFIYLANGPGGLHTYSVDGSGALTHIHSHSPGGTANGVWGDGSFIYLANGPGGLHTYSVDGTGTLTHIHSHDPSGSAFGVWGDGSYVYLANGDGGVHTYSVDGTGTLTHIHSHDPSGSAFGVWGDGSYVYLAGGNGGLLTYSVDGNGTLTHIHSHSPGGTANGVWGDGNYVYLANGDGGLHTYREASRIVVDAGSVGIGVSDPEVALAVSGTVRATSFSGDGFGLTNINSEVISLAGHSVTELDDVSDAGSEQIITDFERLKLSGIEIGAQVTDAAHVSAADAAMDSDFGSEGLMRRGAAAGSYSIVQDNSANWNAAYSWGDHGAIDYLKRDGSLAMTADLDMGGNSITNINAASMAFSDGATISSPKVENWDTAYAWGDHTASDYLKRNGSLAMTGDLDLGGHGITNVTPGSLIYLDGTTVEDVYVNATGDTMTGALNVSADLNVSERIRLGLASGSKTTFVFDTNSANLTVSTTLSGIDQSQVIAPLAGAGQDQPWQSFTAGRDGDLWKVACHLYHDDASGSFYLRSGEGAGGAVLYSNTFAWSHSGWNEETFSTPVEVTEGQVYSYHLALDAARGFTYTSDVYPGGRSSFAEWADFPFKTYVDSEHTNVLVLSGDAMVGVGTDAASEKLTVAGRVAAEGFVGDGSTLTGILGNSISPGVLTDVHISSGGAIAGSKIADVLMLDGSRPMTGDLDAGGHGITNLDFASIVYADGTSVEDKYVDAAGDTVTGALNVNADLNVAERLRLGLVSGSKATFMFDTNSANLTVSTTLSGIDQFQVDAPRRERGRINPGNPSPPGAPATSGRSHVTCVATTRPVRSICDRARAPAARYCTPTPSPGHIPDGTRRRSAYLSR